MEGQILYGLFSDGGNCYSSRDDANWYWMSTEDRPDMTRTEFSKALKQAGRRRAENNYREYCPEFIRTRVFAAKKHS